MYEQYLPHIDMAEGISRVMNNAKLYLSLLGRFKLRPMTEALLEAIAAGDHPAVAAAAHALRGTGANLGFPTLCDLVGEIEQRAKVQQDASTHVTALTAMLETLEPLIARAIAEGSGN